MSGLVQDWDCTQCKEGKGFQETFKDTEEGYMCCQADEDTPSEYRTEHFRSTMDDAYEYLEKIGYFKRDK